MYCEKCRKNPATIHLTEIIKNVKSEVHLCETCAREIGLNSKLSNFSLSVTDFLSFIEADSSDDIREISQDINCLNCGLSPLELKRNMKAGCSECYHYLNDTIEKHLLETQGAFKHCGKIPENYSQPYNTNSQEYVKYNFKKNNNDIGTLKKLLDKAVDEERYEDAAIIRDKIKSFASNGDQLV